MDIGELQADIIAKYEIEPSRGRLYRAKAEALELLRGTVTHHYASLRPYILELMRADPEGRFELLTDGGVFKALYIGFSSLKKGFMEGCRWILGLDGCFLKTHLGGQLLSAIAKDGNDQMYPLAWAVVEVENEECWTWFLNILLQELGVVDGMGISFISDQQKGLINAVQNLASFAEHRNCARHVYCNWKKEFKGPTLKNLFWKAARSTYQAQWEAALEEIKVENEAAYEDFNSRDYRRFCKVLLSTQVQNDMVDNNISETFNGFIVKARSKHIVNMLEDIRISLMERQVKKQQLAEKFDDRVCLAIKKKIEKLMVNARSCIAHPGLRGKFEVQRLEDKFVVDLGNRSCTCRSWNLTGIPCVHGIAAINYMKHDPLEYVHDCYTVEKYRKAYSYAMEPLNGEKLWPKSTANAVLPPFVRIMPGRPKKKRRREHDEVDPKKASRLRKNGVRMTCQRCFQVGHNARGCKNEEVPKPQKEKGKRGRPRKLGAATTGGRQPQPRKRATRGSKGGGAVGRSEDASGEGTSSIGRDSTGEIATQQSQVTN
ncbi:uncharacterized protein LOC131023500 [Salvia miltiorrhiza]|uniref:uncharacterized protein LOC131023500 n=1 Tax=Salvia miltiorrhiza TaxID=226208 RepID=UPI0025AC7F9C|nr:uncharacterized protein LOC131023500 [Salvia miltiorrhiza]